MKKVYETPKVVITAFDSNDSTNNLKLVRSVAAPTSTHKANVKTGTLS